MVHGNSIGDLRSVSFDSSGGLKISDGATGNTVGGPQPGESNVVRGILIQNADSNRIEGNYIGVGTDRTSPLGLVSPNYGVRMEGSSQLVIKGNVVSNAGIHGISIYSGHGNLVTGNDVFGNGTFGDPGAGIAVLDGTGNALRRNLIYENAGLGIDLGADGPDGPGDEFDADTGPNNRQNTAIITAVLDDGSDTVVQGVIRTPQWISDYTVELFENPSCDPSGWGEGASFVASTTATSGVVGEAAFRFTLAGLRTGFFTATVTDSDGNTSEFSKCTDSSLPNAVIFDPGTGNLDIPALQIGGDQLNAAKAKKTYGVRLSQLDEPGYVFAFDGARKLGGLNVLSATYDPATGVVDIPVLEVKGLKKSFHVRLRKRPEAYIFDLLSARKN